MKVEDKRAKTSKPDPNFSPFNARDVKITVSDSSAICLKIKFTMKSIEQNVVNYTTVTTRCYNHCYNTRYNTCCL